MRKAIVAANWKMNMTVEETVAYIATFLAETGDDTTVDVVLIPPFTALANASPLVMDSYSIKLGAQNMSPHKSGAYTGEISAAMLRELFVRYVVIGHSERRQLFGETDQSVNAKLQAVHEATLKPIFCVGETLLERDGGKVEEVLTRQLREGLKNLTAKDVLDTVIAYEPVWAIGTGRTATPEQAQEAHALIRREIGSITDANVAERVRIQYGGSVKGANAAALMSQPDIDGALVGGASLDPREFAEIVKAAKSAKT